MTIIFGIILIIAIFILGGLFWQVFKAKNLVRTMLKEPKALTNFISQLYKAGFFEKKAEEISETGKLWSEALSKKMGFPVVIGMEAKSSMRSFNTPRNIFSVLVLIIFIFGYLYLPFVYIVIAIAIFLLTSLISLSDSGFTRVFKEVSAMAWLVFQFNKSDPIGCRRFVEQAQTLKNLHNVIIQL